MLPPRYSQALLAGESVAGFIVAINRIFTKLVFTERVGAIIFFVVSLLFVLMCVGCFLFIMRSSFVKYHIHRCQRETQTNHQEMRENPSSRGNKEETDEDDLVERQEHHLIQLNNPQPSLRQKISGNLRLILMLEL